MKIIPWHHSSLVRLLNRTGFAPIIAIPFMALPLSCERDKPADHTSNGNTYYLKTDGNDSNKGTRDSPWKSIEKLNSIALHAGDSVLFQGGQVFEGSLVIDSAETGTMNNPIVLTSSLGTAATIHSGNTQALVIDHGAYVNVTNVNFEGNGRKEGNHENGVVIMNSNHVSVDSVDIKGFQKAGLFVYASFNVDVNRVYAHNNGAAGISISGSTGKEGCKSISIRRCVAENNPGDPTNFTNHSGSGIIVGLSRGVTIDYCAATNNGWDMPRTGNGPVGIWAYESDSVIIQHCIAYRNKTSTGAEDGGGFDLDGGVTNSVIQYCLSYENEGAGFGIFQYSGASPWKNNVIRFNISENDGRVSTAHAGIYIWNGSDDEGQFSDCLIYNNTIYNAPGAAILFSGQSKRKGFRYYNNIFIAKDELTKGLSVNDTFLGNDWWSLTGGFNMNGVKSFDTWISQTGQEKLDGKVSGLNRDPDFGNSGMVMITSPLELNSFINYTIPRNSVLRTQGLDLKATFGIETGNKGLNQNSPPVKGIGASF